MAARKSAPPKKADPKKEPAPPPAPAAAPPAPAAAPAPPPAAPTAPRGTPVLSGLNPALGGPQSVDDATVDMELPRGGRVLPPPVQLTFAPRGQDGVAQIDRQLAHIPREGRVRVTYLREAADLGQRGELARIEMGWKFGPQGTPSMAVVADGQRSLQGALVRRSPVLDVPPGADGELQVWFRLVTRDGRELWDSLDAYNHRFPLETD